MIKSVTIDFHTEKSISIISDARLEAILVSVSEKYNRYHCIKYII